MPRTRRIAVACVGVGIAAMAAAIVRSPIGEPVSPVPCTPAVLIDGRLHCDAEADKTLAAACSGIEVAPPADGDAIDLAALCSGAGGRGRMDPASLASLRIVLDLNAATIEDLTSLPRIGPALAQRIVAGRPYREVDDLTRVSGIGPKTLAVIRSRVRITAQAGAHVPPP